MIGSGSGGAWCSLVGKRSVLFLLTSSWCLLNSQSCSLCRPVLRLFVLALFRLTAEFLCWFRDLPAMTGVNPRCSLSDLHSSMSCQEHLEWTSSTFRVPVLPSEVLCHHPVAMGWKSCSDVEAGSGRADFTWLCVAQTIHD